jgi:hypothetical protein
MDNSAYKASGALAGLLDAGNRMEDAASAWFRQVAEGGSAYSPAGRHLFEAAYERAYNRAARGGAAKSSRWQWLLT